nr:MAG TPA: hypothetical protein [Caudoviricetes sp.]
MEHEGVTSPCSFFFLPFRAVTNHGPKANPFPRRGYLVRYKTDRRLPLLYVSCRGTPFTLRCSRVSQSKPTCGADNN